MPHVWYPENHDGPWQEASEFWYSITGGASVGVIVDLT